MYVFESTGKIIICPNTTNRRRDKISLIHFSKRGLLKGKEYSLEFLLGILNSTTVNYLFLKLFFNKYIYAYQLERVPIPLNTNKNSIIEIEKYVTLIIKLNEEIKSEKLQTKINQIKQRIEHSEEKINQLVYELYDLSEGDIKIIESANTK